MSGPPKPTPPPAPKPSAHNKAIRESLERVNASAVQFLDQHPDWTVAQAWAAAEFEESFLYGVPGASTPRGIVRGMDR